MAAAKVTGEIGDKPIAENTRKDYEWRLSHLCRFFGPYPIDQIDTDFCQAFKARKLTEAHETREALEAGADLRDHYGRRPRPLAASSLRSLIDTLKALLDEAIEDHLIDHNPARTRRMKIKVPYPAAPSWKWTSSPPSSTPPLHRTSRCPTSPSSSG